VFFHVFQAELWISQGKQPRYCGSARVVTKVYIFISRNAKWIRKWIWFRKISPRKFRNILQNVTKFRNKTFATFLSIAKDHTSKIS
jgi:hypothetical protein